MTQLQNGLKQGDISWNWNAKRYRVSLQGKIFRGDQRLKSALDIDRHVHVPFRTWYLHVRANPPTTRCYLNSAYDIHPPRKSAKLVKSVRHPFPPSLPFPSPHSGCVLYVGHVSVDDTRGRGRKRATVCSFSGSTEEIGRTRMGANSDEFYLVKLLIDRQNVFDGVKIRPSLGRKGGRKEGRDEVIVKLSRGLRGEGDDFFDGNVCSIEREGGIMLFFRKIEWVWMHSVGNMRKQVEFL